MEKYQKYQPSTFNVQKRDDNGLAFNIIVDGCCYVRRQTSQNKK